MKKIIFLTVFTIFAFVSVSCSEQQTVNNPQTSVAPQSQKNQKEEKTSQTKKKTQPIEAQQTTEAAQPEKVEQTEKAIIIEGLQWSEKSTKKMDWDGAVKYCENLNEDGNNDWHLPTISELRTLIQNCPATQTGGECGLTDNCLSVSCFDNNTFNNTCVGCDYDSSGKYSKLGDTDWLWSSSVKSDYPSFAWLVGFSDGACGSSLKSKSPFNPNKNYTYSVRCVRNAK